MDSTNSSVPVNDLQQSKSKSRFGGLTRGLEYLVNSFLLALIATACANVSSPAGEEVGGAVAGGGALVLAPEETFELEGELLAKGDIGAGTLSVGHDTKLTCVMIEKRSSISELCVGPSQGIESTDEAEWWIDDDPRGAVAVLAQPQPANLAEVRSGGIAEAEFDGPGAFVLHFSAPPYPSSIELESNSGSLEKVSLPQQVNVSANLTVVVRKGTDD